MVKMAAPGFGYGFVVAWAFVLSFLTLMCGLILEGFKDVVSKELEKSKTTLGDGRSASQFENGSNLLLSQRNSLCLRESPHQVAKRHLGSSPHISASVPCMTAADNWTQLATGAFHACYGLSYLVSCMFMLFFLVLLVFQGAVTKELGIYDQMQQQKRLAEMNALASGGMIINPLQAGPI